MKMLFVIIFVLGIYEDIIDEHHNKLVQEVHEDLVHHAHEVGRSIGQPKRHDCKLIQTILRGEGCLGNIFLLDFQLVIPRSEVNL
jgi:hypothetical protein